MLKTRVTGVWWLNGSATSGHPAKTDCWVHPRISDPGEICIYNKSPGHTDSVGPKLCFPLPWADLIGESKEPSLEGSKFKLSARLGPPSIAASLKISDSTCLLELMDQRPLDIHCALCEDG